MKISTKTQSRTQISRKLKEYTITCNLHKATCIMPVTASETILTMQMIYIPWSRVCKTNINKSFWFCLFSRITCWDRMEWNGIENRIE